MKIVEAPLSRLTADVPQIRRVDRRVTMADAKPSADPPGLALARRLASSSLTADERVDLRARGATLVDASEAMKDPRYASIIARMCGDRTLTFAEGFRAVP